MFQHPQSIVQITSIAIPATARRVEECKAFFKVRFRTSSSRPTWCGNTSPATMPWVDIVARKAIANSHKPHPLRRDHGSGALHGIPLPFRTAERQATRHPQQLLNLPPRKERSEWSKNKVLCLAFFQESEPSETPRKKRTPNDFGILWYYQIFLLLVMIPSDFMISTILLKSSTGTSRP